LKRGRHRGRRPDYFASPYPTSTGAGVPSLADPEAIFEVEVIAIIPDGGGDAALEEAATMCGASRVQAIRRIVVPLLGPAMVTTLLAGFIRSLEAFEVEQLLGTSVGVQVYSTQLCFGVAVLSVILFSLLAYVLARTQLWSRGLIATLAWLPWALPSVLLGSALLWLLVSTPGVNVLYGTVGGLLVALLIKEMPLATQILRAGFTQISEELEQAAAVCGAGWLRTYRHIMLPLLAPVLMSVFLLAFVSSLRDISTTILVASASARPLSILMMEYSMGGNLAGATVVATIVTVGAILVALGARRLGLRSDSSVA
jgi:ABC-type Fe3+ transport system permease subunit